MPIKGFFQGDQKDERLVEIHQKLEALEEQMKKINTLEEHLESLNGKEKVNKEKSISKITSPDTFNKVEFVKGFGNIVLDKVKQIIHKERESFQNRFTELHNRISKLENQIALLQKQNKEHVITIQSLQQQKNKHEETGDENPHEGQPIIFQEIHVDKLFMDKYEQITNMGQLDVKELSGQVTIGASYDKGVIPSELAEEWKEQMSQLNQIKQDAFQSKLGKKIDNEGSNKADSDDENL
jgi:DNA repair exonuclease SbcCD ATPase subunit